MSIDVQEEGGVVSRDFSMTWRVLLWAHQGGRTSRTLEWTIRARDPLVVLELRNGALMMLTRNGYQGARTRLEDPWLDHDERVYMWAGEVEDRDVALALRLFERMADNLR